MAIEEVRTPNAPGNTRTGIDDRVGVQHRDPRQGGRRDSQWYVFNGETASGRSILTFCHSRPGGGVHHPPARWYVVLVTIVQHNQLTQPQLTRSISTIVNVFVWSAHGMWGGEARDQRDLV